MGCDIHSYAEVLVDGAWTWARDIFPDAEYAPEVDEVFAYRDYGLFGFLADVRNYSHVPVIAETRGLPDDMSAELSVQREVIGDDGFCESWLILAELLAYDYDQVFWDRRIERRSVNPVTGAVSVNGAALADEGEGEHLTLRAHLGDHYFECLAVLAKLGDPADVRVVFWFDN